ncbi:MAG: hypothetical protein A3K19_24345 [Lentisphaerae bacterium RIFOXYB12_FULL_65_16]|nr:MAG: hypothetical protein A3K18_05430 [Lentisphaerae bacterium RIFOXYA12_64_32]OGV90581.1 MAG: hypothetical protein A3K19_24345 [Lentisphaerae bacterium RIFOXYB12_FULL_65_16]
MAPSAFTLIELLVVIAIIAILASLLLPALNAAKDKGKQAVCLSQLKQVGQGLHMYVDEMDGSLPGSCFQGIYHTGGGVRHISYKLNPYIGDRSVWTCPGAVQDAARLRYYIHRGGTNYFGDPYITPEGPPQRLAWAEKQPGGLVGTWAIEDVDFWNYVNEPFAPPVPTHTYGRNILYFDAHVIWKRSKAGSLP